jgi:hypothetical protein
VLHSSKLIKHVKRGKKKGKKTDLLNLLSLIGNSL